MTLTLTAMRGYSGSGKSTKAREIATETDAVVVNRDYIRKMLLGEWWTGDKDDEDRVTVAETALVDAHLRAGTSVVVDATHLHAPFLRKWARLAAKRGADFEVVDVHCDVAECQRRVYERWSREMGSDSARYIDPKVVDQQAKRWPAAKWPEIKAPPPFIVEPIDKRELDGLPIAIIVDIDGTVAHHEGNRSPFDYSRVLTDKPDHTIIQLVRDWKFNHPNGNVLFVSGRDNTCYHDTEKWLQYHQVPVDWLFMRPADAKDVHGGKLPDYVVKYDLFNFHIRDRFNVKFVLDDRDQVVDVWRRLGLKCLQVAPGDF